MRLPYIKTIIILLSIISQFSIICDAREFNTLLGKTVILPDSQKQIITTSKYTFIHIVRGQECTKCSVGALYQWHNIISLINRDDISYFFIIETRPEDTTEIIQSALERRPFNYPLFIDHSHYFLEKNRWLKKKKYSEINDFILDSSGKVLQIGNPLDDFLFLFYMKNSDFITNTGPL